MILEHLRDSCEVYDQALETAMRPLAELLLTYNLQKPVLGSGVTFRI